MGAAGTPVAMVQAGRAAALARELFGFHELGPGQAEAIEAVAAGRDTLAVMRTGSGKSAIYQVAGQLLDGPTLVVSPLVALQRDQVVSLAGVDAGDALEANSAMSVETGTPP